MHIRHSKIDQQGYGTSVAVHAACPVADMGIFFFKNGPNFQGYCFRAGLAERQRTGGYNLNLRKCFYLVARI